MATGSRDSTIILWDATNGTIARQWVAHGYHRVYTLAFSPDGQHLVSGGKDGSAAVWDLSQEARKVTTLLQCDGADVTRCAWSPDGLAIATVSEDGIMRLWDARTFRQRALHDLGGKGAWTRYLAFSPNGRWLVYVSYQHGYSILDVAQGSLHRSLGGDCPTGNTFSFSAPDGITRAAFNPTSMRIAIAPYGHPPRVNIIDIETGAFTSLHWKTEKSYFWKELIDDISFSPDGSLVLAAVNNPNTCYVWDASTGIGLFQLEGCLGCVPIATFSPCGKYIASAPTNKTVLLWRTSDWSCLANLSDREHSVSHVAFSPDGKMLLSAHDDGQVIIQRMRDIIPPLNTQDDPLLIAPFPPSVVNLTPHPFPLPDGRTGISPDEETGPDELGPTPQECEEVSELEERRIEGDSAGCGITDACIDWDEENEERAAKDSPIADDQGAGLAARSSFGDSMATTSMSGSIAFDSDVSMSSARLLCVTVVEREALGIQGQPPAREAVKDVDGIAPPRALVTAGQENKEHIEGNAVDSGGWGLREPIAGAAIPRDDGGDESVVEGNSLTADSLNLDARTSSEAREAAVEDLLTDAARPSLPTPIEREASKTQGQPPTREAQEDASGEDRVQAAPTAEQETATCSVSGMVGDERMGTAAHSSSRDSTMSSARLSSLFHPEREGLGARGQPPVGEAQEDANREDQVQGTPTVERENTMCSDNEMVGDRSAKSGRRSSSGNSTMSSARLPSMISAEHDELTAQGRPPARETQQDANAPAQAQATPAGERMDLEGTAVSSIASPTNRAANEPERRSEGGMIDLHGTSDRKSVRLCASSKEK